MKIKSCVLLSAALLLGSAHAMSESSGHHKINVKLADNSVVSLSVRDIPVNATMKSQHSSPALEYISQGGSNVTVSQASAAGYQIDIYPVEGSGNSPMALVVVSHTENERIAGLKVQGRDTVIVKPSGCSDSLLIDLEQNASANSDKCGFVVEVAETSK